MLSELRLGGYQREWFFVVRGEPYSILSTAVDSAGKGEMCLADETVQMLLGKLEHTAKTVKVRVIQSLDLSLGDVEDELVSVVSDSDVGGSSAAVVAPGEGGVQPEGGVTNGEGDDMAALPGPPVLTESDTVADTPVPSSGTTPVTPGGGGGVTEEDGSKLTLPKPSVATMSPGGTAQFEEVTQTTFDKAGVRFRWRQLESGAWKIFESKLLGTCSLKMADPVVVCASLHFWAFDFRASPPVLHSPHKLLSSRTILFVLLILLLTHSLTHTPLMCSDSIYSSPR